jgi:hypothetical protein
MLARHPDAVIPWTGREVAGGDHPSKTCIVAGQLALCARLRQ